MRTLNERIELLNEYLHEKQFDSVKEWIEKNNFLKAPASANYHGAYKGGLFDHSVRVAAILIDLTDKNNLKWVKERSPVLVGIAHDFCKFDRYIWNKKTHKFEYNSQITDDRHGERSVEILQKLIPDLTEEEILCIKYHMGFTIPKDEWEGFREAIRKYPNVLWTHQADMLSAFVLNI